ncbi:MAG: CpaD family pilus assembly protein [Pseudomonadota bacterium]
MRQLKILAISALSAASLSACVGGFNGPDAPVDFRENHPIAVDSQVVTLTIDVDQRNNQLSARDEARVKAFAAAYLRNGHGQLTVSAPSGAVEDFDGQELSADIRSAIHEAGVDWGQINGSTYRTSQDLDRRIIVSYTHYIATASKCGVWKGIREATRNNLHSPNFGCATQNNLAAMVADPRDLIQPAAFAPGDSIARIRALDQYRAGQVSATETDSEIEAQVSDQ